jgi:hypothetical protein
MEDATGGGWPAGGSYVRKTSVEENDRFARKRKAFASAGEPACPPGGHVTEWASARIARSSFRSHLAMKRGKSGT